MLSALLSPFLPETSARLRKLLNVPGAGQMGKPWGDFFVPGHKVEPPVVLFPRIDTEKEQARA